MNVLVVSDFNAELVSRFLSADAQQPHCEGQAAPYGQVYQVLANSSSEALFVWTRPEGVIEPYAHFLEGAAVDEVATVEAVTTFARALRDAASRSRTVIVGSWVPTIGRGSGILDWRTGGRARLLALMNVALTDALADLPSVFVLDAQRWLDASRPARDAKSWFATKLPFSPEVCRAAARDVKAAIRAIAGRARKLLVVDLDETLWGGVVGEVGLEGIRLGGHDIRGEAFADFQRALRALSRRGVALAIVSKNDEPVALEAIDHHPEMVLRRNDLAGWRINWKDKAQNIVDLARELNLGVDSAVFIDDNPTERGRVRDALPDVFVPDWPSDPTRYVERLQELDCFETATTTAEDRFRTQSYVQNRARAESQSQAPSLDEWMATLGVRMLIQPYGGSNVDRAVQLLNKTNQLNLRTRRLTRDELEGWLAERPRRQLTTISVADRFGELGLTGLVGWEIRDDSLEIVDFVLSCRAMGRQIERAMVGLAIETARGFGCTRVIAPFVESPRNRPCLDFWRSSGFAEQDGPVFVWDTAQDYPVPEFIEIAKVP